MTESAGAASLPPNTILHEGRLYTQNSAPGWRLKGQPVIEIAGREYRSWSPFTSKIAAFLACGGDASLLDTSGAVLYLGASYGTTVSHISDMLPGSSIYAVEVSRQPFVGLAAMARNHPNVVPLLEDAFHPEMYSAVVSSPALLIEDVAQKDMAGMLLKNLQCFPTLDAFILSVKARCIDSAAEPASVYSATLRRLKESIDTDALITDISRFEGDHAIISGRIRR